jgi:hypothetical protein
MVAPSKPPVPHGMRRRSAGLAHSRLLLGQSRHRLTGVPEGWNASNLEGVIESTIPALAKTSFTLVGNELDRVWEISA